MSFLQQRARTRLLKMHYEAKVGHIGGNLSALDILLTLYHSVLTESDQFILSKGHAAGALYVALWSVGKLMDSDLRTFHGEGTRLGGHPVPGWCDDIPFATGSLGHGLSLAAGLALGMALKGEHGRVFCLTSDGEWNEGSTWEALIFLAHRQLKNLTLIVDINGLQGFGTTDEVARLAPLGPKFAAFGLEVLEISGHDHEELCSALMASSDGPRAILCRTTKGKGVSFMENKMEWHYLPMTAAQYAMASQETSA